MRRIEVKSEKLRPCPFCGGTDDKAPEMVHDTNGLYYARCGNEECALMPVTWYYKTEEEAAEVWNRRVKDDDKI